MGGQILSGVAHRYRYNWVLATWSRIRLNDFRVLKERKQGGNPWGAIEHHVHIPLKVTLAAIFWWKISPVCFVDGTGLTPFQKIGEYILCPSGT